MSSTAGTAQALKCSLCQRDIASGNYINGLVVCDWCLPNNNCSCSELRKEVIYLREKLEALERHVMAPDMLKNPFR